jgi:hypothetical protein
VEQRAADAANPLVHEGQKLIPNVTRVFSRSRDLYVFLQAYRRDANAAQPLDSARGRPFVAFVTFYRGDAKAFETAPVAVESSGDGGTAAVPFRFSVPLESVSPDTYDLQVSVLDPAGQKAAFWRAPVVVVR